MTSSNSISILENQSLKLGAWTPWNNQQSNDGQKQVWLQRLKQSWAEKLHEFPYDSLHDAIFPDTTMNSTPNNLENNLLDASPEFKDLINNFGTPIKLIDKDKDTSSEDKKKLKKEFHKNTCILADVHPGQYLISFANYIDSYSRSMDNFINNLSLKSPNRELLCKQDNDTFFFSGIMSYDILLSAWVLTVCELEITQSKSDYEYLKELNILSLNFLWQNILYETYQLIEGDSYFTLNTEWSNSFKKAINILRYIQFNDIDIDLNKVTWKIGHSENTKNIYECFNSFIGNSSFCEPYNNEIKDKSEQIPFTCSQGASCSIIKDLLAKLENYALGCLLQRNGESKGDIKKCSNGIKKLIDIYFKKSTQLFPKEFKIKTNISIQTLLKFVGDTSYRTLGGLILLIKQNYVKFPNTNFNDKLKELIQKFHSKQDTITEIDQRIQLTSVSWLNSERVAPIRVLLSRFNWSDQQAVSSSVYIAYNTGKRIRELYKGGTEPYTKKYTLCISLDREIKRKNEISLIKTILLFFLKNSDYFTISGPRDFEGEENLVNKFGEDPGAYPKLVIDYSDIIQNINNTSLESAKNEYEDNPDEFIKKTKLLLERDSNTAAENIYDAATKNEEKNPNKNLTDIKQFYLLKKQESDLIKELKNIPQRDGLKHLKEIFYLIDTSSKTDYSNSRNIRKHGIKWNTWIKLKEIWTQKTDSTSNYIDIYNTITAFLLYLKSNKDCKNQKIDDTISQLKVDLTDDEEDIFDTIYMMLKNIYSFFKILEYDIDNIWQSDQKKNTAFFRNDNTGRHTSYGISNKLSAIEFITSFKIFEQQDGGTHNVGDKREATQQPVIEMGSYPQDEIDTDQLPAQFLQYPELKLDILLTEPIDIIKIVNIFSNYNGSYTLNTLTNEDDKRYFFILYLQWIVGDILINIDEEWSGNIDKYLIERVNNIFRLIYLENINEDSNCKWYIDCIIIFINKYCNQEEEQFKLINDLNNKLNSEKKQYEKKTCEELWKALIKPEESMQVESSIPSQTATRVSVSPPDHLPAAQHRASDTSQSMQIESPIPFQTPRLSVSPQNYVPAALPPDTSQSMQVERPLPKFHSRSLLMSNDGTMGGKRNSSKQKSLISINRKSKTKKRRRKQKSKRRKLPYKNRRKSNKRRRRRKHGTRFRIKKKTKKRR